MENMIVKDMARELVEVPDNNSNERVIGEDGDEEGLYNVLAQSQRLEIAQETPEFHGQINEEFCEAFYN